MRFLALLNLFLYFMLSLHTSFDGHVQVLCIEKDGHTAIESYDLAEQLTTQASHDSGTTPHICCPDRLGECEDCTDYYLSSGHPDSQGFWLSADPNLQALSLLEHLPVLEPEPFVTAWGTAPLPDLPPPLLTASTPVHLPSTVLLI